ncbi:MAG: hypothetical protein PHQ28_00165 [Mycobacterium sp.]|nr:hypothetical protein [Mycobacterium sp.]
MNLARDENVLMNNRHYPPPPPPYGTQRVTRLRRPTFVRFLGACGIALVVAYVVFVPLTLHWMHDVGGVSPAGGHYSLGGVLFAIAITGILWVPLTMMMASWLLIPVIMIVAFIGASIRRVSVPAPPPHDGMQA